MKVHKRKWLEPRTGPDEVIQCITHAVQVKVKLELIGTTGHTVYLHNHPRELWPRTNLAETGDRNA